METIIKMSENFEMDSPDDDVYREDGMISRPTLKKSAASHILEDDESNSDEDEYGE